MSVLMSKGRVKLNVAVECVLEHLLDEKCSFHLKGKKGKKDKKGNTTNLKIVRNTVSIGIAVPDKTLNDWLLTGKAKFASKNTSQVKKVAKKVAKKK